MRPGVYPLEPAPMRRSRRQRLRLTLDLTAALLLLAWAAAVLAVATREPATVSPLHLPQDLLGEPGAFVAGKLFTLLGAAAYPFLGLWLVLGLALLLQGRWGNWVWRLLG